MKRMSKITLFVFVFLCFCTGVHAQTELGLMAIGGHLGLVNPDGPIGETVTLGASADLGKVAENLNLDVRLDYWSKSEGVFSLRDFVLGGGVVYTFDKEVAQLRPYAGAGLSLHFLKSKTDLGNFLGENSISNTELGIDLRGGAKYKLNEQIDFAGEILYTLGDAEQFQIKVGALFKLGQ